MSNSNPGTPSISPWWSLLLLPAGLLFGWFVGGLPVAPPREKPAEVKAEAVVSAPAETPPIQVAARRNEGSGWSEVTPHGAEQQRDEPQREEISQWTSFESATAESRRNGKPILIDFNADWCPPCQRMKQQVFDDYSRGRVVQAAVIPVSIVDRRREDGSNLNEVESLQNRYQIEAFPTLIVYSPKTGRSVSKRGFGDADATVEWIEQAARSVR
jgi:thiol:disulfide interchange protein